MSPAFGLQTITLHHSIKHIYPQSSCTNSQKCALSRIPSCTPRKPGVFVWISASSRKSLYSRLPPRVRESPRALAYLPPHSCMLPRRRIYACALVYAPASANIRLRTRVCSRTLVYAPRVRESPRALAHNPVRSRIPLQALA